MKKARSRSRRVTAKQVADELGVSAMTVSRALSDHPNVSEKTRMRVMEASRRLGYSPDHIARSLVLKQTRTIGVIVPEITHSFFPEAIRGIEEVTTRVGYHLILAHSAEEAKREVDALRTLESNRADGILISVAETVQDFAVYREYLRRGVPIVFFDRCARSIGASCVSIDDEESARRVTEHLLDHGYTRLAHLSGPLRVSIGAARLRGFEEAVHGRGLKIDRSLILEAGFHETGGYEAMRKLLAMPPQRRPRAVVAVNDPAAFGAMKAIAQAGLRIPQDIAIVGFSDDIRAELMQCPLTTIRQPAYEVGKVAAQRLLAQIEGRIKRPEEVIVGTELVVRRSCGCGG